MNFDPDELLDHVDEWKFKLHDKLSRMTKAQRAAFWKSIRDEARARGWNVIEHAETATHEEKKSRRAMNYDADELLDEVDKWKSKVNDKLARMTPEQQTAFWKKVEDDMRAQGMNVIDPETWMAERTKRPRRATG